MLDPTPLFIASVFVLAGFAKGVIGLGLPTISMGLLVLVMPTVDAAAILLLPSLLTNVWQMLAGPSFGPILKRLWPMMLGVCAGTWAGIDFMTGPHTRCGEALLGGALALYAAAGLTSLRIAVNKEHEPWLAPMIGGLTGLITAATGVFVLPAVPYLQAIGLDKEDLIQALGLSFTVSTCALAINVALAGGLNIATAGTTFGAFVMACIGMSIGQALRLRLEPATFRRWFFIGLMLLGLYLAARSAL